MQEYSTDSYVPTNQAPSFRLRAAEAFRSPLFLTAAILASLSVLLSLLLSLLGSLFEFPAAPIPPQFSEFDVNYVQAVSTPSINLGSVFPILVAVGLWIAYANAHKNFKRSTGVSILSGTAKATWIVFTVFTALCLLVSILFCTSSALLNDVLKESLSDPQVESSMAQLEMLFSGEDVGTAFALLFSSVFFICTACLAGVSVLIFLFWKFTKSVCRSLESDSYQLAFVRYAKVILLINAIICSIGLLPALLNPLLLVSAAIQAAFYYVLFAWVRQFSLQIKE